MNFKISFFAVLFITLLFPYHGKSQAVDTATASLEFTPLESDSASTVTATQSKIQSKKATVTYAQATPFEKPKTLWNIFLEGLLGGFAALIMPCIYPLLPLTVSYFTKKSGSKRKAISQAMLYGVSIIVIYVALGLAVTLIFGSDALNDLATNGIFNFLFFVMLIVFGVSFLGAFELTLPYALVNKIDAKSDQGGVVGIFFMAMALALVSFSCTGPIIGTLLVDAASKGERLGPAVGMFGFSFALALPFTIFAFFPSAVKSLPKSGGWLNSVKVVLGFIELAFAMKFLSNVDLAYHWNWFDREVFLSLWIVIFALMGFYLLGKLKFSHDSDLRFITVPRVFLSIIVFAFVVYMIPGLWGAPLKSISAFLPPAGTQDFDLYTKSLSGGNAISSPKGEKFNGVKKYAHIFERYTPLGLDGFYDFDQAMEVSKQTHKPILIDFTGFNCVNCRKMENNVWSDARVLGILKNDFILAELYVDDKTDLAPQDQYVSSYSNKKITTIGKKWSDFQASRFNTNSQPFYVITDSSGEILVPPQGANYDPENYLRFLNSGKAAFEKK